MELFIKQGSLVDDNLDLEFSVVDGSQTLAGKKDYAETFKIVAQQRGRKSEASSPKRPTFFTEPDEPVQR